MVIIKKIIIFFIIVGIILAIVPNYDISGNLVVCSFFVIIFMAYRGIFITNKVPYGVSQVFYLFALVFLGIAPLIQYFEHKIFWTSKSLTDSSYLSTNLLLILAFVIYNITYKLKMTNRKGVKPCSDNKTVSKYVLLAISIVSTIVIIVNNGGDVLSLLVRGDFNESEAAEIEGTSYLFYQFFLRPIPALCMLIFKFFHKRGIFIELILLGLMLVTNAPTGIPRLSVAALYIPLIFTYFPQFLSRKYNLSLLIFASIILIFPILNIFRDIDMTESMLGIFTTPDFDSYQMMARVVSVDMVTYGRQLLGVIFFFVPRSIWPTKPIGSGYYIANEEGFYFDNISMNYFGEGYINFGIIGVIMFAIILGYVNALLDKKYWFKSGRNKSLYTAMYFVIIGMVFIIMRGALLNVFPILIGYLTGIYLVYICSKKKIEI